jgi:glycosyltransferase involved in cell wall biosynthesis
MRILMASRGVAPIKAGCGGAEIVVYQLARTMALQGHEVTLVGDLDEDDFDLPPGLEVVRVRNPVRRATRFLPDGLPKWLIQHLLGNVRVARRTRGLLREDRGAFDVVHAHGALSALLISFRNREIPIVYTEHDATPWSCRYRRWYERWIRKAIYRALNVTAFKRANRVVTVFPSQAREIVRYWRVDPAHVSVISNGTDVQVFRPGNGESTRVRTELGFDRYALFVGSLIQRKCPDLLLEAIAETRGVSCVFVGDGPMRPKLERRAQELGIADRVALLGSLAPQEMGRIYSEADVLVLPTVSDAFPLVALEAMACGTAVLATRVSGLPEMIEDWQTGFLVKPGDVGQLAMGIRFLTGDDKLRRRMGQNGRRRVLEGFQWSVATEQYLSVYRSVAGLEELPTLGTQVETTVIRDDDLVISA